jgi:hypothetical protein
VRYSLNRTSGVGVASSQFAELSDVIWWALRYMEDRSPGTKIYIVDNDTGLRFDEAQIHEIAAELPPTSRFMFGDDNA